MIEDRFTERGLPRSYLRAALLMLVAPGPSHGYELLEQLPELGFIAIDTGGLYRMLRAMEQQGSLESWWEVSTSGPPRRTYALTPEGRAALAVEVAEIESTVGLLGDLVDTAARVLGPS